MVYIFCWVFGFDGKDGCSRRCSSLSIAFQANWAPANWVPAYWAPANQAPRICWCDKLSPFILIIQGLNLPHQHFPWVQFEGLNLPKNWQTGPQKVLGPICHQISEGPNFLEPVFRCASILWISHSCFFRFGRPLPDIASGCLIIGSQHW